MDRALPMAVLLLASAVLLGPPSAAQAGTFTVGETPQLRTPWHDGAYTIFAPAQDDDCRESVAQGAVPADGVLPGIRLEHAGHYVIEHAPTTTPTTVDFHVEPLPMRLDVVPLRAPDADGLDYDVRLSTPSGPAADAYLDAYLGDTFIAHRQADGNGELRLRHQDLPFAGPYTLAAYKDLDPDGTGRTSAYSHALQVDDNPACDPADPYDAPETYVRSVGALERGTEPMQLRADVRNLIVRDQPSRAVWNATTPGGAPLPVTAVDFEVNGHSVSPRSLSLDVTLAATGFALTGTWNTTSTRIAIIAHSDTNDDGLDEYTSSTLVHLADAPPIRLAPVGDGAALVVPPPAADGRPGVFRWAFRIFDANGTALTPPTVGESDLRLVGDVLGSSTIQFHPGNQTWLASFTPKNSAGAYRLELASPAGASSVTFQTPPEGGARSTPLDLPPLTANHPGRAAVRIERFNPDLLSRASCTNRPGCAYEAVTDAHVWLVWADTGQRLKDSSGHPIEYMPRAQAQECACSEANGVYTFEGLLTNRSGPLAAVAQIGDAAHPETTYAAVPALPDAVLRPTASPARATAGLYTSYELRADPSLARTELADYDITIQDQDGRDVLQRGHLEDAGDHLRWGASLPPGNYTVRFTDHLNPLNHPPQLGIRGTLTPARISVLPPHLNAELLGDGPRPFNGVLPGGGMAAIQVLRLSVADDTGRPMAGALVLDGAVNGSMAALFAPAPVGATPFAPPRAFPAGQPAWAPNEAHTFADPQGRPVTFRGRLELPSGGAPDVYVWVTGAGTIEASFASSRSSFDQPATLDLPLRLAVPSFKVLGISTNHGNATSLAVGEPNVVHIQIRATSSIPLLADVRLGLGADPVGPGQHASAPLERAGNGTWKASVAIVPQSSGQMRTWLERDASTLDAGLRLEAVPPAELELKPTTGLSILAPNQTIAGTTFQVHVTVDGRPADATVAAFNQTTPILNGTASLRAPPVLNATTYRLNFTVAGFANQTRLLLVLPPSNATLERLTATGIPSQVPEATTLRIRLQAHGDLSAATAELLGRQARANATGELVLQVPPVSSSTNATLRITLAGYPTLTSTLRILDVSRPRLHLSVPLPLVPGQRVNVTLSATDETGAALAVPTNIRAAIEATLAEHVEAHGLQATFQYTVPVLRSSVRVLAVAEAPGFDPVRQVVEIPGAS